MCVGVLPACVSMYYVHAWSLWRPKEEVRLELQMTGGHPWVLGIKLRFRKSSEFFQLMSCPSLNKLLLFIIFIYMCMCLYEFVCTTYVKESPESRTASGDPWVWSHRRLRAVMWMPGTEPRSSARTESALKH